MSDEKKTSLNLGPIAGIKIPPPEPPKPVAPKTARRSAKKCAKKKKV